MAKISEDWDCTEMMTRVFLNKLFNKDSAEITTRKHISSVKLFNHCLSRFNTGNKAYAELLWENLLPACTLSIRQHIDWSFCSQSSKAYFKPFIQSSHSFEATSFTSHHITVEKKFSILLFYVSLSSDITMFPITASHLWGWTWKNVFIRSFYFHLPNGPLCDEKRATTNSRAVFVEDEIWLAIPPFPPLEALWLNHHHSGKFVFCVSSPDC